MSSSVIAHPEWVKMELGDMGETYFNEFPMSKDQLKLKQSSLETAIIFQEYTLLSTLAQTRDGLINSKYREKIWPTLLGLTETFTDTETYREMEMKDSYSSHRDEEQLQKDVDRSFIYYPKDRSQEQLGELRERLSNVVTTLLRKHPDLNYYQGYHDIASVVVLIFPDDNKAFKFLEHLTMFHLRDHMLPFIQPTVHHLNIIIDLLAKVDTKFCKVIEPLEPTYALSSILSLFSHDVQNFDDLCVIWDSIFAQCSTLFPIYLYTAILIYYKDDILTDLEEMCGASFSSDDTCFEDESFIDNNKDILHIVLKNVTSTNLNIASQNTSTEIFAIIQLALSYWSEYPPSCLSSIVNGVSKFSVLKTTSRYVAQPSLNTIHKAIEQYNEDGFLDTILELQSEECRVKEKKRKELLAIENAARQRESLIIEKKKSTNKKLKKNQNKLTTSKLSRFFNSPKTFTNVILRNKSLNVSTLFKISLTVGLISFILNQYATTNHFRDGLGANDPSAIFVQHFVSYSKSFNNNIASMIGIHAAGIKNSLAKLLG